MPGQCYESGAIAVCSMLIQAVDVVPSKRQCMSARQTDRLAGKSIWDPKPGDAARLLRGNAQVLSLGAKQEGAKQVKTNTLHVPDEVEKAMTGQMSNALQSHSNSAPL